VKLGKKLFKAGSKAVSGGKKKGDAAPKWPHGIRIGVFGHANCGKTVFFTVLNEESKVSKDLQISIADTTTAGHLLTHYRAIWGVGTTSDVGTHVDLKGEKKFPAPTRGEHIFQFNAILDRDKKVPVVTLEYEGKAVAITEVSEAKDKIMEFMAGCHGLLIFYDPKMLGAASVTQEQVAAFTNVIEQLAPLNRRLPIPVGLVITKADILPGFSGDDQTVLIAPEHEHFVAGDYDSFLEQVLSTNRLASNSVWAASVRDVLLKLQELLKTVVGRTLDFQVFFTSSTGVTPEKIGTDVGRSIYAPPSRMKPIGVRPPFHWLLRSVLRNRSIGRIRKISKWVSLAAAAWIVLFSIPYALHFWWQIPRLHADENSVVQAHLDRSGTLTDLSQTEVSKITAPYRRYEANWVVNWFFTPFRGVAEQTRLGYMQIEKVDVAKLLDTRTLGFTDIASDSTRWPIKIVGENALAENDNKVRFEQLAGDIDSLYVHENDVPNTRRKERLQWFVAKFREAILTPDQSNQIWSQIDEQITQLESRPDITLAAAEQSLFAVLRKHEKKKETVQRARQTGGDIEVFLKTVNDNEDPKFRLETVPTRLQSELALLKNDPANAETVAKINSYLEQVKQFKSRQNYIYRITDLPAGYHAHVMVRRGSDDSVWRVGRQLWPGLSVDTLNWRMGDQIVVALDGKDDPETWGAESALKKVLRGQTALFDMLQPIEVGAGKKMTVSFETDLMDKLPKVE